MSSYGATIIDLYYYYMVLMSGSFSFTILFYAETTLNPEENNQITYN